MKKGGVVGRVVMSEVWARLTMSKVSSVEELSGRRLVYVVKKGVLGQSEERRGVMSEVWARLTLNKVSSVMRVGLVFTCVCECEWTHLCFTFVIISSLRDWNSCLTSHILSCKFVLFLPPKKILAQW